MLEINKKVENKNQIVAFLDFVPSQQINDEKTRVQNHNLIDSLIKITTTKMDEMVVRKRGKDSLKMKVKELLEKRNL